MANKVNIKKLNNENEMLKFVKMIIILTLIFGAFYVLTYFINKEDEIDNNDDSNNTAVSIQYDEILIGNIFNRKSKNYYVLIEDIEDINIQVYEAYLSLYEQKEDAKRVYTSVLNNIFNAEYYAEESNLTDDISQFKISQTTLLETSDGKIVKSYEGHDDILKILKEISQEEKSESTEED